MLLKFKDFQKYHAKFLKHDTMTAQERFVKAGGKIRQK